MRPLTQLPQPWKALRQPLDQVMVLTVLPVLTSIKTLKSMEQAGRLPVLRLQTASVYKEGKHNTTISSITISRFLQQE